MALSQSLLTEPTAEQLLRDGVMARDARAKHIAVVGAGWAGLQLLQSLKELDVEDVTIFERWDDIGGTWHPSQTYHDLEVHGAVWHTEFANYKFSEKQEIRDVKAKAEDIKAYHDRFVQDMNLKKHFRFNSNVAEVQYDSTANQASLLIEDTETKRKRMEGPFDLVIYCSMTGKPKIPNMPMVDFDGQHFHSRHLNTEKVEDIIRQGKRVAIVGPGKTSADVNLIFLRRGYDQVTWVKRQPYFFLRYEALFHNRSWYGTFRGCLLLISFVLARFVPNFAVWLMWLVGIMVRMPGPNHWNSSKFHFGVLDKDQVDMLMKTSPCIGDPDKLVKGGLLLKDGRLVPADVVIYCTGYSTGLETMRFSKDGTVYKPDEFSPLFEHFILPEIPSFMVSHASFFNFGPIRSVNTAEYAYHHLTRERITMEKMKHAAGRLVLKQNLFSSGLFTGGECFLQDWIKLYEDQWRMGHVTFINFVTFGITLFVLNRPTKCKFSYSQDRLQVNNHK